MVKRSFDVVVSLILIMLLLIPGFIISLCIFVKLGSPILFRQQRPGRYGKVFLMLKFRTMTNEQDSNGELLPDKDRITSLGLFLRKTSLDELPELLNVLKGEMSLVGPRPLLTEYLPLYNDFQKRRHEVRPGITGWAQVNGRNTISWNEKFELDIWYVDNLTFLLDIKIIFKTIKKVLLSEGINQSENLTMQKFNGK